MASYLNSIPKLIVTLFVTLTLTLTAAASPSGKSYVRQACRVTRYRGLCVRTLNPFSSVAGTSPGRWARAGVSAAVAETKGAARYVALLRRPGQPGSASSGRDGAALSDCAECLADAIGGLHASLGVLRRLSGRRQRRASAEEVGDLATWLSAAMTDADTCLDGFRGRRGRRARAVRERVSRASRVMSNALALVNRLASAGS